MLAERERRRRDAIADLHVERRTRHVVRIRILLLSPAPLGERGAQRLVAERRLPARVDHRLHRQAAEVGVHDQQSPAQESDRDGRVAARGALVLRAHDGDAVAAKVDVDALAREAVRAEHALGAAECVRNDRQAPGLHQQVAELERFDRHDRHLHRTRRAAQQDRVADGSSAMPSSSTTRAVSAEWLAPVSSTRRNGPWPLTLTGAQMRPILSRRVGATNRGSSAVTEMLVEHDRRPLQRAPGPRLRPGRSRTVEDPHTSSDCRPDVRFLLSAEAASPGSPCDGNR